MVSESIGGINNVRIVALVPRFTKEKERLGDGVSRSFKERLYKRIMVWAQAKYVECKDNREDIQLGHIAVTDHALLRYFERFEGYDLGDIRAKLLAIKLGHNTRTFKDGKHKAGRLIAVVKDKTILTVYPVGGSDED